MRLISLEVHGYRRLLNVKVNLTGKIIAIVGPNEAGKTSLLHALERLDRGDPVPARDLSRAAGKLDPESVYLKAEYRLEKDDKITFAGLDLKKKPDRMSYGRRVGGGLPVVNFYPAPKRSRTQFDDAIGALQTARPGPAKLMISEPRRIDVETDQRLWQILPIIADENQAIDDTLLGELDTIADRLNQAGRGDLGGQLRTVIQWRQQPEIGQQMYERISSRIPRFLLFSDANRNLLGEYDIRGDVAGNPPPALANVARLADLDLAELLVAIEGGIHGRTRTMLNKANKQLADIFKRFWRQSPITLALDTQGTVLSIMIDEGDDTVTEFDERSAGLHMFVALAAFVATKDTQTPPVLLIDEADVHLHYDAQADLINMLLSQQEAAQVIYTTHSPGCLPPDLGTGIRVIAPAESDKAVSEVRNAFWTDHNAGFSPLLLAMGAGAAAFTATRYAILAEGPSEMILLPSLIRAATGLDSLPYQVAPGLSETPTSQYPSLDLHAAKVAFVVDGDRGGSELRERLVDSGVPAARIAVIGDMTLEDTLDLDAYRDAVHEEAIAANKTEVRPMPADDFHPPRATSVMKWYKRADLIPPSKIAVANRLVQDNMAKPGTEGKRVLEELHNRVMEIFGL